MMRWLGCAGKDALVRMRFLSLNRTGSTPDDALVRAPPLHDALVRLRFLSLNRTGSTPDDALVRAPRLRK